MLVFYLICLIVGGVLVGASALLGGEADTDFDVDVDADVDLDADADADADGDADAEAGHGGAPALADLGVLFPYASLRFWTYGLAFSGLTGTVLTWLAETSVTATAVIAGAVGYACGLGITAAVRKLRQGDISSTPDSRDFVGLSGKVLLPVARDARGQVRVSVKGRSVDLTAETEDGAELRIEADVLVYDVRDDGVVVVTSASNSHQRSLE